jgi:hypothetical protein
VQLEISDRLRCQLFNSDDRFQVFIQSIRSVLDTYTIFLGPKKT